MKIRAEKDFWSGVLFIVFAVVAIITARGYSMGSVGRMGPGYFPIALGCFLALLGIITVAKSLTVDGERMEKLNLGPIATIVVAVALFGLSIERLGLIISIAIVTAILAVVFRGLSWISFLFLTGALIAFSVIVFVYALQLPLSIWPAI